MLRIMQSVSAVAAKKYFNEGLVREGYYSEGQEMVGMWGGRGAKMLGLSGRVEKNAYALLCDNINPVLGGPLTARTKENRRVGADFTFSVPKSVSIAYMWCKEDRERIMSVLVRAVRETMGEIEQAAETRVRKEGQDYDRKTQNLLWAEYFHMCARPVDGVSDPHWHAHIYVFNATHDPVENEWKAAQIGRIKKNAEFYESAFLMRVATGLRELGFEIENSGKFFEIKGIGKELRDKFSRRTKVIEAKAAELGITTDEAKDGLAAITRERKCKEMTLKDLEPHWWSRLSLEDKKALDGLKNGLMRIHEPSSHQLGESLNWKRVMEAGQPRAAGNIPVAVTQADMQAVDLAIKHLFYTQSVVGELDLLRESLKRGYGHATREGIQKALKEFPLHCFNENGERMFTTADVVLEENRIVERCQAGMGKFPAINPTWRIQDEQLNEQQCGMVYHIAGSQSLVVGVKGKAGVGKTKALKEAACMVEAAGISVKAFSPTARASRGTLRQAGFQDAETVDKLLISPWLQEKSRGAVWFVDEAGLMSARQADQLLALAERLGARVVLVGDTGQHRSVERGDAFRLLQEVAKMEVVTIDQIQRQSGAYREAVDLMAKGRYDEAIDAFDRMGAISEIPDSEKRNNAIANLYLTAARECKTSVVIAPTNKECDAVTAKIREVCKAETILRGEGRQWSILRDLHWSPADKLDWHCYQPGQVIKINRYMEAFRKGEEMLVERAWENGVMVRDSQGQKRSLPFSKATAFNVYKPEEIEICQGELLRVTANSESLEGHALNNDDSFRVKAFTRDGKIVLENGWTLPKSFHSLEYGYTSTSHSAQSVTVDWVILAQSSLISSAAIDANEFYTAISRGSERGHIFTESLDALRDDVSCVRIGNWRWNF